MGFQRALIMICTLVLGILPAVASAQDSDINIEGQNNGVTKMRDAYLYSSEMGRFQVMMPSGCAKVHRMTNLGDEADNDGLDESMVQVIVASCDRFEKNGQGCSVTAIFNLTDGNEGPPGADQVLRQVEKTLKKFGAQVQHQTKVSREFADGAKIEGVDVKAVVKGRDGELWIRGLLSGPDVFLLAAWNVRGGLWSNPAYQEFFNSFEPLVD